MYMLSLQVIIYHCMAHLVYKDRSQLVAMKFFFFFFLFNCCVKLYQGSPHGPCAIKSSLKCLNK